MRRTGLLALAGAGLVLLTARQAVAQASMFGVRSLGLPALPVSARAQGTSGAFAFFDPEGALNPASVAGITRPTASFNLAHFWRSSENPFGTADGNDTQFPLFFVGGSLDRRLAGSISVAVYTDRTFALALQDTVVLRDSLFAVRDTMLSKGGVNDIRFAAVYRPSARAAFGLGFHLLTGTNRLEYRRSFEDSSFTDFSVKNELSFSGLGLSAGLMVEAVRNLFLTGMFRVDTDLDIDNDSTDLGTVPMPVTMGGGVQWLAGRRLSVAGHALFQTWSRLDEEVKARGGVGAENTLQLAAGAEIARSLNQPGRFPVRLGVRWSQLPYPLVTEGDAGSELALTGGTGFRFGQDRGSVDVALEYAKRRDDGGFSENSLAFRFGMSIRQ